MKQSIALVSFLVLFTLEAFAAKPAMPDEEREAIELMLQAPQETQEQEEPGRGLRARLDRLLRPRRQSTTQSAIPLLVEEKLKTLLQSYTLGRGWSEETLLKLAAWMGVKETESFKNLDSEIRLEGLAEVLDTYSKVPVDVILTLKSRGKGIDLVSRAVTNHPDLENLRGVTPRGWTNGKTWDEVPGAGAVGTHPTIIAGDSLHAGHGTLDLILHEVGHTVDRFYKNSNLSMEFSSGDLFNHLHTITPFTNLYGTHAGAYAQSHQEENFADMFSLYFFSEETREKLLNDFPEGHVYLESELF